MKSAIILIVDDEKNTAEGLASYLRAYGYEVFTAANAQEALQFIEHTVPDLVLTDLRMGAGLDGIGLMQEVRRKDPSIVVIMMTAYGTIENAVEAMQKGAHHYVMKPVNLDELLVVIRSALEHRNLEAENKELKARLFEAYHPNMVVGKSRAFQKVYQEALQVAQSTASVLLQGESGTGKELIAQLIHQNSPRKDMPFIPVHCAALSENLLESELFGHEKGSFTGATERKLGRFEKADKGTIFLDEIGEIDQRTQVKLLRVLQEGEFERVGGTKTIKADIRLIAATNKNLFEEVKKGTFREDLYYRINVIVLRIPSLHERQEDIKELFNYYVRKFAEDNRKTITTIAPEVYDALCRYAWPGNVRELKNIVERMIVLLRGSEISIADVPHDIRYGTEGDGAVGATTAVVPQTMSEVEKETIRKKLIETRGNKSLAARQLGISRRTLYRKVDEYQLD